MTVKSITHKSMFPKGVITATEEHKSKAIHCCLDEWKCVVNRVFLAACLSSWYRPVQGYQAKRAPTLRTYLNTLFYCLTSSKSGLTRTTPTELISSRPRCARRRIWRSPGSGLRFPTLGGAKLGQPQTNFSCWTHFCKRKRNSRRHYTLIDMLLFILH